MEKNFYKILFMTVFSMAVINLWAQDTPISSYDDLNNIIRNDMASGKTNGSYYLTTDIVIPNGAQWLPFGKKMDWAGSNNANLTQFEGVFDGKGHSIINLTIDKNNPFEDVPANFYNMSGLFSRLGYNAVVKNLGLENVNITGGTPSGGLAGVMFGNGTSLADKVDGTGVTIENVFVTGKITGNTEVGGIVGRSNNCPLNTIRNCYVNAAVEAVNANNCWAGGIVGCMNNGWNLLLENVYAAGSVTSTGYAGGLLGYTNNAATNNDQPFSLTVTGSVVVANTISGGTESKLFNCLGLLDPSKVSITESWGRNDIGVAGGDTRNPADFKSGFFYENTLGWNFMDIWKIETGWKYSYPVFIWQVKDPSNINMPKDTQLWNVSGSNNAIEVTASAPSFLSVYNVAGNEVFAAQVSEYISIPVNQGIYILKLKSAGKESVRKLIVK